MGISGRAGWCVVSCLLLVGCSVDFVAITHPFYSGDSPEPVIECAGDLWSSITVTVQPGENPVFDWDPACPVALLLVEHEGSDQWGITTDGSTWTDASLANQISPPVTYGSVPPSAERLGLSPPEVLDPDVVYELGLWRALGGEEAESCRSPLPENACLVAWHEFYADRAPPAQPQIAFWSDHDGNHDIYVVNEDGSSLRKLTGEATMDLLPVWSPGGLRIAYSAGDAGRFSLNVMTEQGTDVTDVGVAALGGHDWSPDGSSIVHSSGGDLFVVNVSGGGLTRLTDTPEDESSPAWSPDGRRVAFAEIVLAAPPRASLYVLESDGSLSQLTDDGWFNVEPAWSPDGTMIAYSSWRDPDWQVRLMDAGGSTSVKLVDGQSPSWSPDGSRIVFTHPDGGLYTVSVDGSDPVRLTTFGGDPDWSN